MLSLPAKSLSGIATVVGVSGVVWPDKVQAKVHLAMTPDHIRLVGSALLIAAVAYFILLWWLKPDTVPAGGQTTHGPGSPAIGAIHGNPVFQGGPPSPLPLNSAAATQTVEVIKHLEITYCRKSLHELHNMIQLDDNFRWSIVQVVHRELGNAFVSKDLHGQADRFFEGGSAKVNINFTRSWVGQPVQNIILVPGEVACINVSKAACDVTADLQKFSRSPFLSAELADAVAQFHEAIENALAYMIVFFNQQFKKEPILLARAVEDMTARVVLYHEFKREAGDLEVSLNQLRDALRRSVGNG